MEREDNIFAVKKEQDPTSYNETEMDLDIEIRAGEWKNVKKIQKKANMNNPSFLSTYQTVSSKLTQVIKEYYSSLSKRQQQPLHLRTKIQKLRHAQDTLLSYLLWEPEKKFDPEILSSDTWELLQ